MCSILSPRNRITHQISRDDSNQSNNDNSNLNPDVTISPPPSPLTPTVLLATGPNGTAAATTSLSLRACLALLRQALLVTCGL